MNDVTVRLVVSNTSLVLSSKRPPRRKEIINPEIPI